MRTGHRFLPSDCPQVQCVHPYVAQQPDELTLELADILNILDKTEDGEAQCWRLCPRGSLHLPRAQRSPSPRLALASASPLQWEG